MRPRSTPIASFSSKPPESDHEGAEEPVSVEESQQKRWPDLEKTVDAPVPEPAQPAAKPAPIQDKTERLDDVIAKLRQHPSVDPAAAPAPERPPERRAVPAPEPVRAKESVPAARPSPSGRKLVVYGERAPGAAPTPPPARPSAAPPPSPGAAGTTGQRSRWIGIAAIVAAIVVLFALILWALIAVVRGAPRSGRAASRETVAEARSDRSIPKSE